MSADIIDFPIQHSRPYFRPGDRVMALDTGQTGIIQIMADDGAIIVQHFNGLRLRYRAGQLDHDGGLG